MMVAVPTGLSLPTLMLMFVLALVLFGVTRMRS